VKPPTPGGEGVEKAKAARKSCQYTSVLVAEFHAYRHRVGRQKPVKGLVMRLMPDMVS
jgi:hypothetical protein